MWESGSQGTENLTNGSPLLLVLRLSRSLLGPSESPLATHGSHSHPPPRPLLPHPQKCTHTLKQRQLSKQRCLAHLRVPDKSWAEAF